MVKGLRDNKNIFKNRSLILIRWEVGGESLVISVLTRNLKISFQILR